MTEYIAKQPDSNGDIAFTDAENNVWELLITRQLRIIQNRACKEFLAGLDHIKFPLNYIPQLEEINTKLTVTGWQMVPVTGTINVSKFFKLLSERKFPAATFIRTIEDLDYLTQPDIFHEYFGHAPMLTNQIYANFLQWYGHFAQQLTTTQQNILSRLFWYTIEFGLLQTEQGNRIFGGGILSSYKETIYALAEQNVIYAPYILSDILVTEYNYDQIQTKYFVLSDLKDLYNIGQQNDLIDIIAKIQSNKQKGFITC